MLNHYRSVFRAPGSAAFCTAGFIMRMPIAILPLALVLLVSLRTHHYGFAGVLSAVYIVGGAIGNPLLARLADRYGQHHILLPSTAVHAAGIIALAALAEVRAPDWALLLPALVMGLAYVSVGSLVRARWSYVIRDRSQLTTAYSLESTLDEVIFVVGPLIATVVATQADPIWVLVICALLVSTGAVLLDRSRDTEPPPHPEGEPHPQSAIRTSGIPRLILATIGMGTFFGGMDVALVAFCGQHGHSGLAGVVLACVACGSAIAGLFYGARHWRADVVRRFAAQAVVFGTLPWLVLAAPNIPVLAVFALVVGVGIAPTLITAFGVVEKLVPPASLTEGLAWVMTGLNIGAGIGAAVVGVLADHFGARTAFLAPIAAAVSVAVVAVTLARSLTVWQERQTQIIVST